ncbi:MAG: helix-turn-helix transcriptional regulator, partial [Eubacterium sp.]
QCEIRHYRVDKMMNVNITDEKRDGERLFRNFDMAVYAKKTFGMFAGEERDVTLRCKDSLAGVMIDRFGQGIVMKSEEDGFFTVTVKAAVSPLFLTWLMNFGSDIKILSPDDVINKYIETAKECLDVYQD